MCAVTGDGDVRDHREPGQSLLEVPDPLEVGVSSGEQVDYREAHRLAFADSEERRPILARHDLVAIADGGS